MILKIGQKKMKANELMIGDIVTWKGNICYVISVENLGGLVGVENEKFCELVSDKELEPIPLTEEILKANELNPIICCNLSMPKWYMSLRSGNRHVEMSFKYVHQLQHALRLCGLNELADNFKIE